MIRNPLASLILPLCALTFGCSESATETVDKAQVISSESIEQVAFNTAGLPTVSFQVPSMHCEAMCVPKVRDTLAKQPGVKEVNIDLETKTAVVAVEGEAFDADKAIQALEGADFSDVSLKPTEELTFNTGGLSTVSFTVPSMHCEVMCVPKVRDTLAKQPGVKEVSVDLETKTATVAIEQDAFDSDKAIEALKTADFSDVSLKADAS